MCPVAVLIRKGLRMADLFNLIDGATKCFITLPPYSKVPTTNNWRNNGLTFEEACYPDANVGIILGETSGILDIDLDCKEAVALADIVLPEPYAVFSRGTDDSMHTSTAAPHSATEKPSMATALKQLLSSFEEMVRKP